MTPPTLKPIEVMVAHDLGNGYIKIVMVIETKVYEYKVKKSVAVSMITTLAQSLDGNLHSV
jgi:hypothetical protein